MMHAFERLVGRVLDERVVPFLGSGISMDARIEGDADFEPSVPWMAQQVQGKLDELLERENRRENTQLVEQLRAVVSNGVAKQTTTPTAAQRTTVCDPLEREQSKACQPAVDSEVPDCKSNGNSGQTSGKASKLDQAADLLTWLSGATQLCRTLRIADFTRLKPLPAHRFCAYLAREGMVTEVITTNYDTCIETAFRASFGGSKDSLSRERAEEALAVVFDLSQYRTLAGKARTAFGDPVLHLYKINGDAEDFRDALDDHRRHSDPVRLERRAARIIVTERQLQTYRDELWAKDLFADRARCRSLFFCGFGSEEPQVRHHAMTLMEEMQRQAQPVETLDAIANQPNAPFFAVYGEHLAFSQLQVMVGFARAHIRPSVPTDGVPVLRAAYNNALTGKLCGLFKSPTLSCPVETGDSHAKRLPADLLFTRLFQAVWVRRVNRELAPGGSLDNWLRSMVVERRAWCDWLGTWVWPTRALPQELNGREYDDKVFRALFGLAADLFPQSQQPNSFMSWLHAVWTGGGSDDRSSCGDFYLPLRQEPLFILVTLLFCGWLSGAAGDKSARDWQTRIRPAPGLGLQIELPDDGRTQGFAGARRYVFLAREGERERVEAWQESLPNTVWLIEIPGTDQLKGTHQQHVAIGRPLLPVVVERRGAADVIRAARVPSATPADVLASVFRNAHSGERI